MIKRMVLAIFLFSISTPAMALTYKEIAKACIMYRKKISISDCISCARDVVKFCSHLAGTSDPKEVKVCLDAHHDDLRTSCQKTLKKYSKPT